METLRTSYESLGLYNIKSCLQSGNVVFKSNELRINELELSINQQIEKVFGFKLPIIVLTIDYLKQVIEKNPFLKQNDKDVNYLHVTFLNLKPQITDFEIIETKKLNKEEILISEKAIYLYCPNRYGKNKID